MDRVVVVGCGGSGKSFVAKRLGAVLGLPVTHLDAIYYDREWNPLPHHEFALRQERLVAGRRWLIEGNYASTLAIRLAAAETVIFLDLPALVCLWGIVQRRLRYRGGQHAADGVFDRITWGFLRYVVSYRKAMRPKVIALARGHTGLVILRSRRAANAFLESCLKPRESPSDPAEDRAC
jgi:adenylate kinase family enzyme